MNVRMVKKLLSLKNECKVHTLTHTLINAFHTLMKVERVSRARARPKYRDKMRQRQRKPK